MNNNIPRTPIMLTGRLLDHERALKQQAEPVQKPAGQLQECVYGRGQVFWFNKPADKSMLYTTPVQPLTERQAQAIAYIGPVYATNGVVTRSALGYRKEIEQHRMDAIRRTEAAHDIKRKS
jgi:hypothetical protein